MGTPSVETPTPPARPTVGESTEDYIRNIPALVESAKEYQPQYAALQKQIGEELYPTTAGLQEKLAAMGEQGMGEDMPGAWREQYRSNMASMLGPNTKSTIGADYMSTGLMNLNKSWKDYYTNLALTASGRQPLASAPTGQQMQQGFSPGQAMGFNASTYGPYAGAYTSMYGTNAQMAAQQGQRPFQYMQGAGNLLQGAGSMWGSQPTYNFETNY